MKYSNPVIPGFYPDPSVCRVGEDYYLVTSTFEYFPGVPIFHSRDLVNWQQIGHCLSRPSQLPLVGAKSSGGIYAPTIRYHDGTFYMVTTNTSAAGNFFVSTDDPAGEWSEPIWLDQGGIDPSLFFDDDGKVYLTSSRNMQSEIDIVTGKLLSEPKQVWESTGGKYPEAPHLYKIEGTYYLMIAEGGTEFGHMETIARSASPWGPFEECPHNPILTHRNRGGHIIQATGHADLVEAHDGSWWMVFLAVRAPEDSYPAVHHIGRETFLAPVIWEDGWPVVNGDGRVELEMEAPCLPEHECEAEDIRDDFDSEELALRWNFLRNPNSEDWSLAERPGWLTLNGSAVTLDDIGSPAWVGRRQQHVNCRASALMEFEPEDEGEEAGLTIRMNERHHYDIAITLIEGERSAVVRRRIGDVITDAVTKGIGSGPVVLTIEADEEFYHLGCSIGGKQPLIVRGQTRYLSSQVAGGFTGVYFAMFAFGYGEKCLTPASFDWFEYTPV